MKKLYGLIQHRGSHLVKLVGMRVCYERIYQQREFSEEIKTVVLFCDSEGVLDIFP